MAFTATTVSSFETVDNKKQSFMWDEKVRGLGVRVTASGSKSFIFQSRLAGTTLRITIGSTENWKIEQARKEARKFQTQIDRGIDPRKLKKDKIDEIKNQRKTAMREEVKFIDAWDLYIDSRKKHWSKNHLNDHSKLMRGIRSGSSKPGPLNRFKKTKLSSLTEREIINWIKKEGDIRPTQAALAFRLLRGFINWCNEDENFKGIVSSDVVNSKRVRSYLPRPKPRQDALQKNQLEDWFTEVQKLNPIISAFLQIALLTGARRQELLELKWSDVDMKWRKIKLSDKVEDYRIIPLTPYVTHLMNQLPRKNKWVFSSKTSHTGHLVEPTKSLNSALKKANIEHVTIHGLRRSFSTLTDWIALPHGVVSQIMGHKPSATSEKHYKHRPTDLLLQWHIAIEKWIIEQAKIEFDYTYEGQELISLRT